MKSRKLALFIFSLMIIPNVGCQGWYNVRDSFYYCEPIDEAIHSYNCHRAAKGAWKARSDRFCGRERFDHFGAGFRAGYADVAMGGTGCPPPLPPRSYWGWRYQNCEGQQCVASWFDGYPAGARAAEEDGVSNWSRMQTSYIIDAQYAARMPGARRGGPLPPVGGFPGEEVLEEVPAAAPETKVPAPAPAAAPAAPDNSYAPETEATEEVRVIRNLDQSSQVSARVAELPKIVKRPKIVAAAAKTSATPAQPIVAPIEESPTPAEGTSEPVESTTQEETPIRSLDSGETTEASAPATLRKFEMPVVEMLSGVSVPKKQDATTADETEVETVEAVPEEVLEASKEEVDTSKPALVRTPSLAPVTPAPIAGLVEETPAYTLDATEESSSTNRGAAASAASIKRTLPPIVPSKPKKQAPPIVRPVEEKGRFTKIEKSAPAKQVSYDSEEIEEVPGLRRIGKSKEAND